MTTNDAKKPDTLVVITPSDREVAISRAFNAPRELLIETWTKPELLKRWLYGPDDWRLTVCTIDLRVGGALRFEWHHQNGKFMGMSGIYREIALPDRLVWTEEFDDNWTGGETVVTLTFVERAGKTTVTETVLYSSQATRDAALKTGMVSGMEAGYVRLVELLKERQK